MSKEETPEQRLQRLEKLVSKLIELETRKVEASIHEEREIEIESTQRISRTEMEEELKQHPLGELVIFALRKNLIKRTND